MQTLKVGTTVTVDGRFKNAFINKVNEDGTYQVRWFSEIFDNVKFEDITVQED